MDDELLSAFINESREHLSTIENDLLAIEEAGAGVDVELVNKVFRAAHSIKGASSFFGLNKVKEVAHKAETVLDMLRSRKMVANAEITNVLLAGFDRLREMIENPAQSEEQDTSELVRGLTSLASSYLAHEQKSSLVERVTLIPKSGGSAMELAQIDYDLAVHSGKTIYSVEYDLIHDVERRGLDVLKLFHGLWDAGEILDCTVDLEAAGDLDNVIGKRLPLRLVFATQHALSELDAVFPQNRECVSVLQGGVTTVHSNDPTPITQSVAPAMLADAHTATKTTEASAAATATVEETIRVNVGVLERLMNLAGELVLGRNQLRAAIHRRDNRAVVASDQRLHQVTTELQDVIMQTRLQPIGNVFHKFPRVVRDLAGTLGKEVELDIRGIEVALDKSLIEALSDPLTHMVRNAVDHGIESPRERLRCGKRANGVVRIDARHEAGQVVVEISDDGQGIDGARVAQAAEAKGLIARDQIQRMSAEDKMALIFLPGLSTAQKVTDVSGRGVGMDVVKTNLDRLGGKVEISSELGKGTCFRIKLPLTLAIIPSLIVSVEGERFAIPQINVEELLRVRPEQAKTRIEVVGGTEVLVLRDRLIPLVRFANLLKVVPTYRDAASGEAEIDRRQNLADRRSLRDEARRIVLPNATRRDVGERRRKASSALPIVVVTTGTQSYALVVGAFHDTEEIVVKPLGSHLKRLREYAGATILGDGTAALILDIAGLAQKAEIRSVSGSARALEQKELTDAARLMDTHALLLFHNGAEQLCATPVDNIARIERLRPEQVENIGGRRTMQYRGGLLPLVALSDSANVASIVAAKELAVMISNVRGHDVGLLGTLPVDVIESNASIDQVTHRQKGIAGSAVIRQRTALIADLHELVDAARPEWATERLAASVGSTCDESAVVLLAEDSEFFRAQVSRYLQEDGYTVLAAPDGEAAWQLLEGNLGRVRVVVCDIEMPKLDGLGLARRIRADARTAKLPVIALTSLASEEDVTRVKNAGIDEYQTKLDRDNLMHSIQRLVSKGAHVAAV